MSKTAAGLLEHCKKALASKVQYVYGAKMQVLTYSQIKALQDRYGKYCVKDSDLSKAGKMCCDCSGLISSYTGVTRGSSQYKDMAKDEVSIGELKANWNKYVGWGLWLKGHIGVVSDTEGYYYAMDGSARNMVHLPLNKNSWVCAIKLCDIDYPSTASRFPSPIIGEASIKEDDEMVTKTRLKSNGKTAEVSRILKDGRNYIYIRDMEKLGYDVGYDEQTKTPSLDLVFSDVKLKINGKEATVKGVNIDGNNIVVLRGLIETLGGIDIDYADGTVIITSNE